MQGIERQREIVDRRVLIGDIDDIVERHGGSAERARNDVLALLKDTLTQGRARVQARFEAGAGGLETYAANAFLIDQIIRLIYDFAYEHVYPLANPTSGERQAVVAVGGYGRAEMAPYSDVDLMFLQSYKATAHTEQVVEFMLYMLWDLGLKVGHSVRSIDDCMRLAKDDVTIATALLEARYLWGDHPLYAELRHRFFAFAAESDPIGFVEAKLTERDARHEKLGDSRYVLEPNIKEGKGGLRDLHTLYWISKYLYQVDRVTDLVAQGVFTEKEAATFEKAHDFLATVRCHLHYLAGRAEERLTFDVQLRLAERMSYTDHAGTTGVERFMKHYYLHAKEVGDLTRIFCAALEAKHKRRPRLSLGRLLDRRREVGDFVIKGGRITVAKASAFRDDPVNFLRLFHVAQERDLDIHPEALRRITQDLPRIDHALREDPEANRLFLEILTSPKAPDEALKRMNEAGVFGRFVPDFGRVVAQMQYDMYHVYTVDEHTIRAIGLLHRIEQGTLAEDHPLSTEVVHKVKSRRALYVAVLLHDIAKGRGGDHSVLGEEIARKLGPRFGLSEEETETVAWLVLHHLAMSITAQKRDIDDPKTITDFAALVQSPERLRLLLVLTVADMRATGPTVFNHWKAALLRELYHRTEEALSGEPMGGGVPARVRDAQEALRAELKDWSEEDVERHLALGYPAYWLSFDPEQHARQARMVREAERSGQLLAIDTRVDTARAVTEVTVYAPDHPGLFSRIAGGMALAGANIVDAKIFTLTNGKALDAFAVQDEAGQAFQRSDQLARLVTRLEQSLSGTIRVERELEGRESLPKRARVFEVPPRVFVDNDASKTHTVIEVNGRDRPGLLSDVTAALTEAGLQISSAKIATYGEQVVDVFYVKDVFGMKVDHRRKLDAVREKLLAVLREGGAADAETADADAA